MTGLEFIGPILAGVGATTSLIGGIQQGNAQAEQAKQQAAAAQYKAEMERRKANEDQAVSQRQAISENQKATILNSRTQALAAASGGGASDPTVLNIMGDVAGRGEYNALSALYTGSAQAAGLNDQANIDMWQAENYRKSAGTLRTAGLLSGISSFASAASKTKFG